MIFADDRASEGVELFEIDGFQAFEMNNDTMKMCADDDGTLWDSVRGLEVKDADGNTVFSLSWSETGVCGMLHDEDFTVEIEEEF
mgnify:FL=1|tara:strand:+ start:196 stop:450 length:255 start_codon:yes stop_codon:yes gene_type:complete